MDGQKLHDERLKALESRLEAKSATEMEERRKSAANAGNGASGDAPAKKWKRGDRVCFTDPDPVGRVYTVKVGNGEGRATIQLEEVPTAWFDPHQFVEVEANGGLGTACFYCGRFHNHSDGPHAPGCSAAPSDLPPVTVEALPVVSGLTNIRLDEDGDCRCFECGAHFEFVDWLSDLDEDVPSFCPSCGRKNSAKCGNDRVEDIRRGGPPAPPDDNVEKRGG